MDIRSKRKVQVCFIRDEDVENIIVRQDIKTDNKTQGKRKAIPSQDVTPKKLIAHLSDDFDLYNTLGEEPDIKEDLCNSKRPYALFENGDVLGHQIFGFQTPKRRNAMAQKAAESAGNTPKASADKNSNIQTPKRRNAMTQKAAESAGNTPKASADKNSNIQTPKRQNATAQKAAESAGNTPKASADKNSNIQTPKRNTCTRTPKENGISHTPTCTPKRKEVLSTPSRTQKAKSNVGVAEITKTPYNLRKKIKKRISQVVHAADMSSEDEAEDLSASESDWEGAENDMNECTDDDDEGSESGGDDNNEDKDISFKANSKHNTALWATQLQGHSHTSYKKLDYVVAPEQYFTSHASSKVATSNRTLSHLRTPRLSQDVLQQLLAHVHPSHEKAVEALAARHSKMFPRWKFSLREGFNILLHGVGSKRSILNTFHAQLGDDPVLLVNGFFPSLTIQQIVDAITKDILELSSTPSDLFETVDLIRATFSKSSSITLYLIIHNIDGPMLRNDKSQEVLSILASAANIHLLASMDHINTPLLWDQAKLGLFNFSWWDATSFLPYSAETSFESSLLVQQSGSLALSSLQNVFRSLTTNARSIFLLMAKFQLQKRSSPNYAGMPFRDLYSSSRETLLVSSDLALRSQLTEFLDHRLVKSKRGTDGSELLLIPIDATILGQFVEEQDEAK